MPRLSLGSGAPPLAAVAPRPLVEPHRGDSLSGDLEIDDAVPPVPDAQARGLAAKPHQHAMRVHVAVVRGEGGDIDIVDPHRWKAVLHPLAVEQLDPRVVRGLDAPIPDQ